MHIGVFQLFYYFLVQFLYFFLAHRFLFVCLFLKRGTFEGFIHTCLKRVPLYDDVAVPERKRSLTIGITFHLLFELLFVPRLTKELCVCQCGCLFQCSLRNFSVWQCVCVCECVCVCVCVYACVRVWCGKACYKQL